MKEYFLNEMYQYNFLPHPVLARKISSTKLNGKMGETKGLTFFYNTGDMYTDASYYIYYMTNLPPVYYKVNDAGFLTLEKE